jgi:thiopeptide-type bacteriocin biosynthesis protein
LPLIFHGDLLFSKLSLSSCCDDRFVVMEIAKQIICRACLLPRAAELADCWNILLEMISASSPVLSEKLKGVPPSELNSLDLRTKFSVLRYFNRAKFRPIPYGRFASVGVLLPNKPTTNFVLNEQVHVSSLPDWSRSEKLIDAGKPSKEDWLWRVQSTLYTENGSHYFYQSTEGQTELFCLEGFTELNQLLEFCELERTTAEIRTFAKNDWDFYAGMLTQLAELQVLVHSGMPNVTGQDYFDRVNSADTSSFTDNYDVCFRHGNGMWPNQSLQKELVEYAKFAAQHLPNLQLNDLAEFKRTFSHRYENQWQALASVLDPVKGIGYAGLASADDATVEKLVPKPEKRFPILEMDSFNSFLLAGIADGCTIDLKRFTEKSDCPASLPNTMSVLVQKADDDCWLLDHMGGATANALLGRFASDERIGNVAKALAELEQEANPDVLFFDVAYQTGQRTDNINRRPQLYTLELALGGWSTHACQLQLADIFINVINGQVVLYSSRHCCRVVPRIASAYNTLRSSHPLLRLLADLQYQDLHCQFLPELLQRFPHMNHYPEIRYGKLVIHAETWRVAEEASRSHADLSNWLSQSKVARFLKVGHADQYLCLDMESETDRSLLLNALQRDHSLKYVSTWLSGNDTGALDQAGKHFAYQLQLNLTHRNVVYQPINRFEKPLAAAAWRLGEAWFFVSLYVTSTLQDLVLLELVSPLIKRHAALLETWFYVLYRDPEHHIRLRLKWRPGVTSSERWMVCQEIGTWLGCKGIRDMAVRPYLPEMQRYGTSTISLVEDFFSIDSEEALTEMVYNEDERLLNCFSWMKNMICLAFPEIEDRKHFLERMAATFAAEMRWDHSQFKVINQTWRELPEIKADNSDRLKALWNCISAIAPVEKRQQLLGDLIHMHVNRRFANHARLREAQLYQYQLLYLRKALRFGSSEQIFAH